MIHDISVYPCSFWMRFSYCSLCHELFPPSLILSCAVYNCFFITVFVSNVYGVRVSVARLRVSKASSFLTPLASLTPIAIPDGIDCFFVVIALLPPPLHNVHGVVMASCERKKV